MCSRPWFKYTALVVLGLCLTVNVLAEMKHLSPTPSEEADPRVDHDQGEQGPLHPPAAKYFETGQIARTWSGLSAKLQAR